MPSKSRLKSTKQELFVFSRSIQVVVLFLSVFLVLFCIFLFNVYKVDLGGTFTIVVPQKSGEVKLVVYGLDEEKLTRFIIPAETMMDVSMQRGEWRMGSVWKLIESENLDKSVLTNTVIKSLKVPVDGWSEVEADGIKFITSDSSLGLLKRIKLLSFASGVSNKNHEDVNFADTSYLFEARFTDGEMGFKRQSEMSAKLRHYFVSPEVAIESEKIEVINMAANSKYSISSLLSTLETMGSHVLSVRDDSIDENLDCLVESKRKSETVKKIINIFQCKYVDKSTGNFESRVLVGEKFLERF